MREMCVLERALNVEVEILSANRAGHSRKAARSQSRAAREFPQHLACALQILPARRKAAPHRSRTISAPPRPADAFSFPGNREDADAPNIIPSSRWAHSRR